MLRRIVQLLAATLVIAGAWLIITGMGPGLPALLMGAVIFLAVRYERWREPARPPASGPHWQATGERFEDPGNGKTVEVHYNPATGERRYSSDGDRTAGDS
jgi:hypothetical protein